MLFDNPSLRISDFWNVKIVLGELGEVSFGMLELG